MSQKKSLKKAASKPSKASSKKSLESKAVKAEVVDRVPRKELSKGSAGLPALSDGLTAYLDRIQQYSLLTREQEEEIALRYKEEGDPKDAEILVTSNLRFVVKVAAEYSKFGTKLIDLIQEGNMGLMHAVREFNPYKGVRLITYAVWWIRGYIQEHLMRQYSMVRIGTTQNQRKLFYKLEKEKNRLGQMGIEPTVKLLSTNLGVTENDVELMQQRMSSRDMSLDLPVSPDGTTKLLDFREDGSVGIDDQLIKQESLQVLDGVVDKLKPQLNTKELHILEQRILADSPKTLQEIGTEWGVSREAVRQMEARVIKKIKNSLVPSIENLKP